MDLSSQLRLGFKRWYYHDEPPPTTCKSTTSLSSQWMQRHGNDFPQDIREARELPLHHNCCCLRIQMEQWEYLSFIGFTQRDSLCTISSYLLCRLRNRQTPLTTKDAKPIEESLSLPLLQLWVKPKATKHQFCLKNKIRALKVHLYDLCNSSGMEEHLLAGTLLPHTIQVVNTEVIE